ncbi:hypothetical protein [Sorangium cellulosum]|uniref:hypothetical protein n=1 Tax=Sorangium cellulosum TaxID=56 RepID=UPI001E4D5EBB|nr:hypothetical protein [Sorangium cellulosum]
MMRRLPARTASRGISRRRVDGGSLRRLDPATQADLEALPPHIKGEIIEGVRYTQPRPRSRHQRVLDLEARTFTWSRLHEGKWLALGVAVGEADPSHAPARRAQKKAGFDREIPSVWMVRRLD